jgi:hypothetical protein
VADAVAAEQEPVAQARAAPGRNEIPSTSRGAATDIRAPPAFSNPADYPDLSRPRHCGFVLLAADSISSSGEMLTVPEVVLILRSQCL